MNVRRTKVAWDPRFTRVECLDQQGNPYYCAFERNDEGAAAELREVPAAAGRLGIHSALSSWLLARAAELRGLLR